jgi:hypothetical protein
LPPQVLCGGVKCDGVVSKVSETAVAPITEEPSDQAGAMIVIHFEVRRIPTGLGRLTDRTAVVLL